MTFSKISINSTLRNGVHEFVVVLVKKWRKI